MHVYLQLLQLLYILFLAFLLLLRMIDLKGHRFDCCISLTSSLDVVFVPGIEPDVLPSQEVVSTIRKSLLLIRKNWLTNRYWKQPIAAALLFTLNWLCIQFRTLISRSQSKLHLWGVAGASSWKRFWDLSGSQWVEEVGWGSGNAWMGGEGGGQTGGAVAMDASMELLLCQNKKKKKLKRNLNVKGCQKTGRDKKSGEKSWDLTAWGG